MSRFVAKNVECWCGGPLDVLLRVVCKGEISRVVSRNVWFRCSEPHGVSQNGFRFGEDEAFSRGVEPLMIPEEPLMINGAGRFFIMN